MIRDYDCDYDYNKNASQKTCKKDPADKNSKWKQTNYLHVNVNDVKEGCKGSTLEKYRKFGCCCDTDSLRDLLLFFRRNNTPIFILSETFPVLIENPTTTPVFINSIVGNLVYISRGSSSGPVIALMPLCEIDHVLASSVGPIPDLANLINEIIAKPTLEKDDCCCIKGVGDTINSVSNISLLLPITKATLLESNAFIILFALLILASAQTTTAVANDDLYILFFENQNVGFYLITPICNIGSLIVAENVFDGNGNGAVTFSTMANGLLPYLSKDMKEKLENININKLLKEIEGIPFNEALKKVTSELL